MKNQKLISVLLLSVLTIGMIGYFYDTFKSTNTPKTPTLILQPAPVFNGDSAYSLVAKQVDFGPRVPNTKAHDACGKWLADRLKQYGCEVTQQQFTTQTYDGVKLNATNIIGSINPKASKRVLLAAHWDTRPFADKDTGANKDQPFDGANDGGSGVGILLEIARSIQNAKLKPNIGVDIILFDAEDFFLPTNKVTQV